MQLGTSTAVRQHLQVQYEAHGLGRVPEPTGEISDVGPEHVALLLETRPEVVSFHFRLPDPEVIRALLAGRHPIALTPTRLLRLSKDLPHDWLEQRRFLGFAA